MIGCLSFTELCARTGASSQRMRMFLTDWEAEGTAECVGNDHWRLTPSAAAEYVFAFRAMRRGNVPLAPGDDDGLTPCKPGPQKAAA